MKYVKEKLRVRIKGKYKDEEECKKLCNEELKKVKIKQIPDPGSNMNKCKPANSKSSAILIEPQV